MAHARDSLPAHVRRSGSGRWVFSPTVTLALWQLRQTWRLLLVIGVGIVAAVLLVCAIPLYSQLTMTAGLRGALTSSTQNADIVVRSYSKRISSTIITATTQHLNGEFEKQLGSTIVTPQFSLQTQAMQLVGTADTMVLYSASMNQAAAHVTLLQGRLPRACSGSISCALEIALRPESADLLHVTVDSVLRTKIFFVDASQVITPYTFTVHIVGIFKLTTPNDPFWHGNDFNYVPNGTILYKALTPTETMLPLLTHLSDTEATQGRFFADKPLLWWYYHFDTDHITIDNLGTMVNGTLNVKLDDSNDPALDQSPFIQESVTYLPSDILERYQNRVAVAQFPVFGLLVLVLCLVLFFVATMAELLVDRQAEVIAVIRSRGASQEQVFGALVAQSITLGIVALLAGPFLALLVVRFLVQNSLPSTDQGVLNLLDQQLPVILGLSGYALLAAGITVAAMILAIRSALRLNTLTLRREMARVTRAPLWQRLNLDIVALLLALAGYGFSLYITGSGTLDPQLRILLLSPLTMLEAVFLLVGSMLLLLRCLPLLLQGGAWLATRGRGAAPLLALTQMTRTPRQSIRMTLLLALATAFAIFSLVFTASQTQRIVDISDYQGGADFSGMIPGGILDPKQQAFQTAAYERIHGVTSASVGFSGSADAGGNNRETTINFKAVDADTYANTVTWTKQDAVQSLSALMAELAAQRAAASANKTVPAIVDSATWDALHLTPGATFTLSFTQPDYEELVNFTTIAEVRHIPTPDESALPAVLTDYQSFAAVYSQKAAKANVAPIPLNFVWLRTYNDAASLQSVRNELANGDYILDPLYDRQALLDNLLDDPLYLTLLGILELGATAALLLALMGNLITSWLSAFSRLTNFAVLRALGSSQHQVAGVLLWEQSIVYATAIVLGLAFGLLLALMVLPALVFTSVPSNESNGVITNSAFFAVQSIPPIQTIIPVSLDIALAALVCICILAVGMMVRIVSRPSLSQALRLNED